MDQPTAVLEHPEARPESAPETPASPSWRGRFGALPLSAKVALFLDVAVVLALSAFVLVQLQPSLVAADTTPAGGDMGAHVWGPAFLRDHLLTDLRLSGWSPDWYAGFPAYQFSRVVPALRVVAVNAGFQGWAALGALAAGAVVALAAVRARSRRARVAFALAAAAVVLFGVGLPYGVAFKVVTVFGPLSLPLACYLFGRLAGLTFPGPALAAVASVPFLFNREPLANNTGNIIGGNLTSTLAGEFSFSISLSLAVVYLGVVLRGLRTGRHRALAAVLLALTGLCHIIPAFFALAGTAVAFAFSRPYRPRLRWLVPTLGVAGLLSAFWVLPFVWQRPYLNDMGWEKIPAGIASRSVADVVTDPALRGEVVATLLPDPLRWVAVLAAVGLVVSIVMRVRVGLFLAVIALSFAAAFVLVPQGRLWNARLLPFWLLCLFLLAAVAVCELGRAVATLCSADPERPSFAVDAGVAVLATLGALVLVGLPLGVLPGGADTASGGYRWFGFDVSAEDRSPVRGWARWNYSGYERKAAYPEYHDLISSMDAVGESRGCGRAMWEYENDRLNSYGTPMAPMLLPFWTDGCIGSMEGLFFESSATTPYHFLNQAELSSQPSRAQRDLPYSAFDIDAGVEHLQLMGVRYYLAFSDVAVQAASAHPELTEVAASGPWRVYEVSGAALVAPLANEPAVLTGVDPHQGWLDQAVEFFAGAPDTPFAERVFPVAGGPSSWARIEPGQSAPVRPVQPAVVSGIDAGTDTISFDVDRAGTPVLVKASYFPTWEVSGAEGPFRVAPNLMVVVPTEPHVELRYGRAPVDLVALVLTLVGIAGALWLSRRPAVTMPEPPPPRSGRTDRPDGPRGPSGPAGERDDGRDGSGPAGDGDGDHRPGPARWPGREPVLTGEPGSA